MANAQRATWRQARGRAVGGRDRQHQVEGSSPKSRRWSPRSCRSYSSPRSYRNPRWWSRLRHCRSPRSQWILRSSQSSSRSSSCRRYLLRARWRCPRSMTHCCHCPPSNRCSELSRFRFRYLRSETGSRLQLAHRAGLDASRARARTASRLHPHSERNSGDSSAGDALRREVPS
jgi:hypothetical protein